MRRPPLTIAGVYAILDLPYPHPLDPVAVVEALIAGGVRVLQLRAKSADSQTRRRWLELIAGPCEAAGVALIINDDLALAEAGLPGVVGLHLGQADLACLGPTLDARRLRRERLRAAGVALGVSTHNLAQVRLALAQLDPDYLGFGPVFATSTKLDADPVVGVEALARACAESPAPIVAIGGVDSARAGALVDTGVAAIAAIGALTGDTVEIVRERTFALVRSFNC